MTTTSRSTNKSTSKNTLTRRDLLATGVALGAITALGTSSVYSQPAGKLVVYSTTHPAVQERLAGAFTAKSGIEVQSLRLNSSALAQRFLAEQNAGQHICDVLTLGNDIFFRKITADGMLISLADRPGVANLDPFWHEDDHFIKITASPGVIAYNPKLLPEALIPSNWDDLLKPEFKGKIIMTDPRVNETLVPFLALLQQVFGDDFLRKLGQQELILVPVTQQGVEQVAAGEAWVVLPCNPGNLERYAGEDAPVKLAPTPPAPSWTSYYTGIPVTAPNPDAARAWFDFTLSREGQEILCKNVSVSPLEGVPGALPRPSGQLMEPDLEESIGKSNELFDLLGLPA